MEVELQGFYVGLGGGQLGTSPGCSPGPGAHHQEGSGDLSPKDGAAGNAAPSTRVRFGEGLGWQEERPGREQKGSICSYLRRAEWLHHGA